eukprot:1448924-Amphidinium_carterae.1
MLLGPALATAAFLQAQAVLESAGGNVIGSFVTGSLPQCDTQGSSTNILRRVMRVALPSSLPVLLAMEAQSSRLAHCSSRRSVTIGTMWGNQPSKVSAFPMFELTL